MILTIRTDKPEAEIGLYTPDGHQLAHHTWLAHRELADTIFTKLQALLAEESASFADLSGLVVFRGPGSFTGLRIGIAVANSITYAQQIPVVGEMGDDWAQRGVERLRSGVNDQIVLPEYGREANITQPKH